MIVLHISILLFQYNATWQLSIYTELYLYMQVDMNLPLFKQTKTLQLECNVNKSYN